MKLRIKGNSVRLRLSKSDVETLGSEGVVEEEVHFGGPHSPLIYSLRTSHDDVISASFDGRGISISIPEPMADDWIGSEEVGMVAIQMVGENEGLRILVEKDFACLSGRRG